MNMLVQARCAVSLLSHYVAAMTLKSHTNTTSSSTVHIPSLVIPPSEHGMQMILSRHDKPLSPLGCKKKGR